MDYKITICIPCMWKTNEELIDAIASADTGFIYSGSVIRSTVSGEFAKLEQCHRIPTLGKHFRILSNGRFEESELEIIDNHEMVLFVFCRSGHVNAAASALRIGKTLLKAAGLAIIIEDSLICYQRDECLSLSDESTLDLFRAFVNFVTHDTFLESHGMRIFGKPDGLIQFPETIEPKFALASFLTYVIDAESDLKEFATFTPEKDSEIFMIRKESSSNYHSANDSAYNPNDIWVLWGT